MTHEKGSAAVSFALNDGHCNALDNRDGTDGRQNSHDITAVVPTWNPEVTMQACLESIRSQTYPCTLVTAGNQPTDGDYHDCFQVRRCSTTE